MIIVTVLKITCIVMIFEFFVDWIRCIFDGSNIEDVNYCYNCQAGWCMEVPGSEKCKEISKKEDTEKCSKKKEKI